MYFLKKKIEQIYQFYIDESLYIGGSWKASDGSDQVSVSASSTSGLFLVLVEDLFIDS